MAVDVADFRGRFPTTFDAVADATIKAALEHATEHVDATVWRTRADTGIAYLAAHLLVAGPFGQPARLTSDKATSTYKREFDRLVRMVGGAYRLTP